MPQTEPLPNWVNWIAQDSDGSWWGYEVEPQQYHAGWYENELGRTIKLDRQEFCPEWETTLQRITVCSPDR